MSSADESPSKRNLPPWLKEALETDKRLTKAACDAFDKSYGLIKYRPTFKQLEISCHGIPWLGGTFAMLYFSPGNAVLWMNLLCLLLLDIVVVSVLKVFFFQRAVFHSRLPKNIVYALPCITKCINISIVFKAYFLLKSSEQSVATTPELF